MMDSRTRLDRRFPQERAGVTMWGVPVSLRLLILSVSITLFFNIWQFQYSFSLADEGHFWCSVQQVMKGAVPLRDFMPMTRDDTTRRLL